MPIVNYKEKAEQSENNLFENPNISQKNKQAVKKFIRVYSHGDARRYIIFHHAPKFLTKVEDLEKDMHDPNIIEPLFKQLRDELSINYYHTVYTVAKQICRKLNDGNTPKGFKNVTGVSRKKQKRKLNPEDMLSWEDGLKLINATNSAQIKAIVATQLDGGFRPSEFIDLRYGDCKVKNDFIIVYVQDGKTGSRNVILWRAAPHLLRWLQTHPTKKKTDPLWLQETQTNGKIKQYDYAAVLKRIRALGERVKLDKPLDFYNIRHSACTLSKMDNIPEEEAAKKFGHSVQYYTETYGRLTAEDSIKRFGKAYGLAEQKKQVMEKTILCLRCDTINVPKAEVCEKCGAALNVKKALELEKTKTDRITELEDQMVKLNTAVLLLTKELLEGKQAKA